MAIQKTENRLNKFIYRSITLALMLVFMTSTGWATITDASVVLSTDNAGNGIAAIGDTITFSCRSTTTDPTQYPYVDLSVFGNPYFPLGNIVGERYSAILTVSPGSIDNESKIFKFFDENHVSGVNVPSNFKIDNSRPKSTSGLSVSGSSGPSGLFKVGDNLEIKITMSTTDSDVISADLSSIGLGSDVELVAIGGTTSAPKYGLSKPFPMNLQGNDTGITITATDYAGNSNSWNTSVSYDTIAPEIQSVTAVNSTVGKEWVAEGDTVRIQATISEYDFDTVKVSHSELIPYGEIMTKQAGSTPGLSAVYEYDYHVSDSSMLTSNLVSFKVEAIDDAGNESTPKNSNSLKFDIVPLTFDTIGVELIESSGITNDIAIIGDQLRFFGKFSSSMDNVSVTVDLSSIGGVNNQIIPFTADKTFELFYTIHQYTSEDSVPRAFVITAKDDASKEINQVALPVMYVDNDPPVISAGQVKNVTRPGQKVRHGDTIAIEANVNKLDGGRVWVDFERLGGTSESTLSPYSGSTYRLEHVVGDPVAGSPVDQMMSFTIYAVDNAENKVQTVTAPVFIDNDPPVILESSYTNSTWPLSPSHPYVRVGDRITFNVKVEGLFGQINDGTRVFMNLPEFGYVSPKEMSFNGMDAYTLSVDVPAGDVNDTHNFSFYAEDNAGNRCSGAVEVKVDNKKPDVGPMAVNFMTDLNVTGIVNIGDRLEFIVPVANPDSGTATLDLSYVGGSSAYIMNYDPVLSRYYHVHDVTEAAMESSSYVFKAVVSDKAGNTMNSLSSTFDVDARPPIILSANATHINLGGLSNVVNIGDKVKVVAEVPLGTIDGGVPTVDLSFLGGDSNQRLYDDGAHGDGLANDGTFGYEHTVIAGNTDGENVALVVQVTDNAGNRVIENTSPVFVDNKPLVISSCTVNQIFDNNGNNIVDLDGFYTTFPQVATDQVRIEVRITGNPTDMGTLTVDLTALGINDTAYPIPVTAEAGGWLGFVEVMPRKGTTNLANGTGSGKDVAFTVTLTDVNANKVVKNTTNTIDIDNRPPKIEVYPISFVLDEGRLGEANLGDVIQVRVRLNDHDGILPQIDFTNLYLQNGMTPPGPTLFPPNTTGGNEYVYQWTVPEGFGSVASLTLLAYDQSGNMTYGYTNEIRFLSKIPVIADYSASRAELSLDMISPPIGNNIANPPSNVFPGLNDQVTLTAVLSSAFNINNSPSATVLADVRSIISSANDDELPKYNDGDPKTYWAELTYQAPPVSGAGNYVYRRTFNVGAGKVEMDEAKFGVKVLHPDVSSIVMASSTIVSDPDDSFAIDTLVPNVSRVFLNVIDENNDNIASNAMNIGDMLQIGAEIVRFDDPGSVTAILMAPDNTTEVHRVQLQKFGVTNIWRNNFAVATHTLTGWPVLNGVGYPRYKVIVSDDAHNFDSRSGIATFTIKNTPPVIADAKLTIDNKNPENWVVNVGNGVNPDGIDASLTLTDPNDLGKVYVDFSSIGGTSTYRLNNETLNPVISTQPGFIASATGYDLATRTFRLWAEDKAGNKAFVDRQLAVDTKRPSIIAASYDGVTLDMEFDEPVDPNSVDVFLIRIGSQLDHSITLSNRVVALDPVNDLVINVLPSNILNIQLSPNTKAQIADWGLTTLYLSMADPNWPPVNPVMLDKAGNWLWQLPRTPATFTVDVTNNYTVRPKLVGGSYDASTNTSKDYLDLFFDKDMDDTTIDTSTLKELSIWNDRSNPLDSFANRYRFALAAADTVVPWGLSPGDTLRRVRINLSQQAQDWIAMNYTRAGTQFHLAIRGTAYEPPPSSHIPLIRDMEGNRVMPMEYNNATAGVLLPLNTPFSIQNSKLDLTGPTPILTIGFQNSPARRVRLYNDPYKNLSDSIELSRDLPIGLTRVFLYGDQNMTGSLPLNQDMVDYAKFKTMNTDFASTTITIPLTSEALRIMLGWGSSQFYIASDDGAFSDLWGNPNLRYPAQSNQAIPINPIHMPLGIPQPSIQSVAVSPAKTLSRDSTLIKGQMPSNLYYEVAFETAKVSADVRIPIDRTRTPVLKLFTQNDMANPKDTAQFVSWADHNQGGITRTVAVFTNNSDLDSSANIQREPVVFEVSNFTDVFNSGSSYSEIASRAYNLADKDTSINGFKNASYPAQLDNQPPSVTSVTPQVSIGITPAESQVFSVTFDEDMDTDRSSTLQPQLRLGDGATTVMSFNFESWTGTNVANFRNSSSFDLSTPQGTFTYYISGGYDVAGNRGGNDIDTGDQLNIRSRGPNIESYEISTYQSTTAKESSPTGDVIDMPFSPDVEPGIATITVNLKALPVGSTHRLHFCQGNSSLGNVPLNFTGLAGRATWDGILDSGPIGKTGPTTYVLRVYDEEDNEGSARGQIVYDGQAPRVTHWEFGNVRTFGGKSYFSPNVQSFVKVDLIGPGSADVLKMRLIKPGVSTDTYPMTEMSGGGYTLSFDGKNSNRPAGTLEDGEYIVNVVDLAGNVGVPSAGSSKATGTLIIDRDAPSVSSINSYLLDPGSMSYDSTDPVDRFNPNSGNWLRIAVDSTDATVASGTAMVRIMTGSTLIKELPLQGGASPYFVDWDGNDDQLQPVTDGSYEISVIDLAGNEATSVTKDITVVTSIFEVTDVSQVNARCIKITFSHPVNEADAGLLGNYVLTSNIPTGIRVVSAELDDENKNEVNVSLDGDLSHGEEYTLKVNSCRSVDNVIITSGNNSGQFTADTKGPGLVKITYDGITEQNKFNLVFDEEVEADSARQKGNYNLVSGTDTIDLESVVLRSDLKSVIITIDGKEIVEGQVYTIVASGVKDLFENLSDGNTARLAFEGRDVTPPELTITAFSSPANEFDISVAVKSNEALSGPPTATVTQEGGIAVSLTLNGGPNLMYIGGAHLDMNYPGVATINVSAKDTSDNLGKANKSFTTAFVNAFVRAQIASPDDVFKAVFEPGTLNKNSMVAVVPETLAKFEASSTRASMIMPSVFEGMQQSQLASLRASSIGGGNSAQELVPVGTAYSISVPAGRIEKPVAMRMSLTAEQKEAGVSLYRSDISGYWKPVAAKISDDEITFTAESAGTFAMLKDVVAPRASMMSEITEEPIREARPSFVWKLEEYGSGVDYETVRVALNNRSELVAVDSKADAAWFVPTEDLPGGDYELVFSVADMAGNKRVNETLRFKLAPPLKIHEVVQFPNPARRRATMRVSTNRNDLGWDQLEVKIYDTAGHKVADNNNLVIRFGTSKSRQNHDVIWDLRASGGKPVANGVYFAKITVRDPDDWNKTARYTHKIAVLR